jgi:phosphatidate phosphatase APP1
VERPHLAGVVEDRWNRLLAGLLRSRGWRHLVVPHVGYAGPDVVRVLARVVHAPEAPDDRPQGRDRLADLQLRRGWRNFLTAEAPHVEVTVTVGGTTHTVRTDRSGVFDARLPNPGLTPGWTDVRLATAESEPVLARVVVVGADQDSGIVSDIDDTVIRTYLPRPLLAAYNTFVLQEQARRPVPGMAWMYDALLRDHPGAPTFYVSTGAWNTAGTLSRFLARHGFPAGPLLLTDWGPTNTGWFRSGREHKRVCLETLAADLPAIRWFLVGDDGQHDPAIYAEFARAHPDRVRAIAIRELTATQQVLAHGTPVEKTDDPERVPESIPMVRGEDGDALARALLPPGSAAV